jgi:hypothetical protein
LTIKEDCSLTILIFITEHSVGPAINKNIDGVARNIEGALTEISEISSALTSADLISRAIPRKQVSRRFLSAAARGKLVKS